MHLHQAVVMRIGLSALFSVAVFGNAAYGQDQSVSDIRAELARQRTELDAERRRLAEQQLRLDDALRRLEAVEAQKTSVVAPMGGGAPLPPAEQPQAEPPVPAGEGPWFEIFGFTQLDAIYDINRVDPNWNATLRPSKIPVECPGDPGCGKDGETIFSARQSRLGFKGFAPTDYGDLKTLFEFDLFSTGEKAGQTDFRLRHVWGELGSVGAGQTWSLFMDPDVFPNTVDYWGPSGMIFLRNPQIRWTVLDDDNNKFGVALEAPNSALDTGKANEFDPNLRVSSHNQWPDLTLQYRNTGDYGHLQLAGLAREVGYESPENEDNRPAGQRFGFGANATAGVNTFDKDQILLQFAYGKAIASYFNDGGSDLAPRGEEGGAKALPIIGWLAYYNRYWSDQWTSSIGYSETRQNTTSGQLGDAFETGQYFSVNLLYHPLEEVLFGPEFLWGQRENRDEQNGHDSRIQFTAKYEFGAAFGKKKE